MQVILIICVGFYHQNRFHTINIIDFTWNMCDVDYESINIGKFKANYKLKSIQFIAFADDDVTCLVG